MERSELYKVVRNSLLVELAKTGDKNVPVSILNRHVQLSRADVIKLFGAGYRLRPIKEMSQSGQFACEEKITLLGPRGTIADVRVIGPECQQTQVEVSFTDSQLLGIKPVVRMSGNLLGTPGIRLSGPAGVVQLHSGVIVPARHLHMSSEQAVEKIARETIDRLARTEKVAHTCLVLVPSYLTDLSVVQSYIANKAESCELTVVHNGLCDLSVFPAKAAYINIIDGFQKNIVVSSLCSFDDIVCLQPPLSLLDKILSADDSDFYSFILVRAALHGIPVSISAGFRHIDANKGVFFEKVRTLIGGMVDMGFRVNFPEESAATQAIAQSDSTLITEEDVMVQYRNGSRVIAADRRAIITPLARDRIRELGIILEQA